MTSISGQTAQPSVLASDLEVSGDIQSTGEVVVQAQVTGNIVASVVAIHAGATVTGDIEAGQVTIDGRINGQVVAGKVIVTRSGEIRGALHYRSLTVEADATIEGELQRIAPSAPPHA